MDGEQVGWDKINAAYNGFVIEAGDATEYPDFAAFQKHIRSATLAARYEPESHVLHVDYTSGADRLECGYHTLYGGSWDKNIPSNQCFPYRRVNGGEPYLAKGIDRDSTLSQQGTTGRLEKHGAVLTGTPGNMAYLLAVPQAGTYCAWNPLPEPTFWSLAVPAGAGQTMTVTGDGRLGMTRVVAEPSANRIAIDYAVRPDQNTRDTARAMLIFGCTEPPTVSLNGQRVKALPIRDIAGEPAFMVPLVDLL